MRLDPTRCGNLLYVLIVGSGCLMDGCGRVGDLGELELPILFSALELLGYLVWFLWCSHDDCS